MACSTESMIVALKAEPRQRHYDAGCTESALRRRFLMHGLLKRIQAFHINAFDGYDMFSGSIAQRHEAGCHGTVMQTVFDQFTTYDGAGATITFAASDLGAGQVLMVAYEIQQYRTGWKIRSYQIFIQEKTCHHLVIKLRQL